MSVKRIGCTQSFVFSWILNWLSDQPYSKVTSRFSVSTSILRVGQRLPGEGLDAITQPVYFLPSPGK
jgi:chaperone BCS1